MEIYCKILPVDILTSQVGASIVNVRRAMYIQKLFSLAEVFFVMTKMVNMTLNLVKVGGWTCWSRPTLSRVVQSASLIIIMIYQIIIIIFSIIIILNLSDNNQTTWEEGKGTTRRSAAGEEDLIIVICQFQVYFRVLANIWGTAKPARWKWQIQKKQNNKRNPGNVYSKVVLTGGGLFCDIHTDIQLKRLQHYITIIIMIVIIIVQWVPRTIFSTSPPTSQDAQPQHWHLIQILKEIILI